MNLPRNISSRRKFIALIVGVASALLVGEQAIATKKPTKRPAKKRAKKATKKTTKKTTTTPATEPSPAMSAPPSASPSPSGGTGAAPANAQALTIAGKNLTIADLAVGATTAATFLKSGATTTVLVTRVNDTNFVALRPVCTHANGPVELSGSSLVCLWHNSRFDQRTGAVINGPDSAPLPSENVFLYGETLYYLP